ncbi:TauD/TfdA family dioxygenase [Frankia sp. CNm7]|uniref:TauD/TfdA family dioxygenase n=1 Tax=Frankia nepalensis TaxID=1836974 RepID=A0A937RQ88_9ACTN|nr:TauD/TfdA family dioxygenase [Frankia nepalensis]MBL7498881.1 TauD/TfdA family dioxygenase [Frankia nepalensis]MBL7512556.1 TauD/TfdA family dioxygenase [Frankia nepalensis]MBL7524244.1 TauD/TfdA family dioxygenase [Frankia nepalensis]MBL7632929.1 TauD/TfdA family dioxygenase [Frankia nepalensis]
MSGHIGAEIFGVDLRAPLEPAVVAEIRAALLKWKVVFFRDQPLTPAQQIAFGRLFGEVTPGHPTLPTLEGHPEVFPLDSRAYQGLGDSFRVKSLWHTDVTFVLNPPMGSILRGLIVPPYGGDTQWTNLVTAYETLSPEVRTFIDGLHAVHVNQLHLEYGDGNKLAAQFASTPYETVHPVVRVHPETGERALFVNPNFTKRIVELSNTEGKAILNLLYEHLATPAFTVRFRWQPDSIAFWDNRATAHLVPTDYGHLGYDRVMHRITLAGDVPVGPDGKPSEALEGGSFS